jgi:hypothetical protein
MISSLNRSWTLKKLVLAILSASALLGGIYASYWVGLQRGLQQSAYAHAIHMRSHLATLECLQVNQLPQAHSMLETSLAVGIVLISPEGKFLAPRTEKAVLDVLGEAKAYRAKYPWSGYSSGVTEKVEHVLSNVEVKPRTPNCQ